MMFHVHQAGIAEIRQKNWGILQFQEFVIHGLPTRPGDGYKWSQKDLVIGSVVKNAIAKNKIIYPKDIEK